MIQHGIDFVLRKEHQLFGFFARITLVGLIRYHLKDENKLLHLFYVAINILEVAYFWQTIVNVWVAFLFNLVKV